MTGLSCRIASLPHQPPAPSLTVVPVGQMSQPPDCSLTRRQLECLRWAGEGKSSVDIGSILDISAATVNEHLTDACRRLGVRTRVQAIVAAYRRGWLE